MIAQPVMLQPGAAQLAFWNRFQREVERRVEECNEIAEDSLWAISGIDEPFNRITVERVACPGNRIECWFDMERGILTCAPGPAVIAEPLRFEWNFGTLLLDGRVCTVEEALRLVLDELVCTAEE